LCKKNVGEIDENFILDTTKLDVTHVMPFSSDQKLELTKDNT